MKDSRGDQIEVGDILIHAHNDSFEYMVVTVNANSCNAVCASGHASSQHQAKEWVFRVQEWVTVIRKGKAMLELKITKEKVQEAAKGCPDAARVLKTLFPEAFTPEPFNTSEFILRGVRLALSPMGVNGFIEGRASGEFRHKGFYLPTAKYDPTFAKRWTVEVDKEGVYVLLPHRE